MSTPLDLREELVNSLSEGGGRGLGSGGEMGVAGLLSPGQPRGEASEAVLGKKAGRRQASAWLGLPSHLPWS